MKRTQAAVAVLPLVVGLAACGSSETEEPTKEKTPEPKSMYKVTMVKPADAKGFKTELTKRWKPDMGETDAQLLEWGKRACTIQSDKVMDSGNSTSMILAKEMVAADWDPEVADDAASDIVSAAAAGDGTLCKVEVVTAPSRDERRP